MKHSLDWIKYLQFPLLITNRDGVIINYNSYLEKLINEVYLGGNIKELFDQWEIQENKIMVMKNEQLFLLHSSHFVQEEEEHVQYIVMDGSHFLVLKQKITELDNLNCELDTILENSHDGIYITDHEGTILKTNSGMERFTGYSKEFYIGKNVKDLVREGVIKESIILKVLDQKKTVNLIPSHFVGEETLATGTPIFYKNGEIKKVISTLRDLSELKELHNELKKALELNNQYKREIEMLRTGASRDRDVIFESKKMMELYDLADRIIDVDATVLILGETGVGKEVLASYIYHSGNRCNTGEIVKINCGAIPPHLLESELFGYEAGAFTGANKSGKPGLFELANHGVLFLDEVGELPLALQVKLLRVLQEKQIQRIGATKPIVIDVRLISATNRDLKQMVKQGEFREDLYYRLNVIPISIPPLRERKEDILPLVMHFLNKLNQKYKMSKEFDRGCKEFFYHYTWPGNVRELTNLVERLILTVPYHIITAQDLPREYKQYEHLPVDYTKIMTLKEATELAERELLSLAAKKFNSTYKIAEELGSSQSTIVRKMNKYNIN